MGSALQASQALEIKRTRPKGIGKADSVKTESRSGLRYLPTHSSRAIDGMCHATAPPDEAARKGRPADPGLPVERCAYPMTDRRRGSGFRALPSSAASPSQAKLCPFGSQKPPSGRSPDFELGKPCQTAPHHTDRTNNRHCQRNVSLEFGSLYIERTLYPSLRTLHMLIGNSAKTDKQISKALCSGELSKSESLFMQRISARIDRYRDRAHLSPNEAKFLNTVLTRLEQKGRPQPQRTNPKRTPHVTPTPSLPALQSPALLAPSKTGEIEQAVPTQSEISVIPPWKPAPRPASLPATRYVLRPLVEMILNKKTHLQNKPPPPTAEDSALFIDKVFARQEAKRSQAQVMEARLRRQQGRELK
jgi:hypothetical protein